MKKLAILAFHPYVEEPPTYPIHPVMPNNACPTRLPATAGTIFGQDSISNICQYEVYESHGLQNQPFLPHEAFQD